MDRQALGALLRGARESTGITLLEMQQLTGVSREVLRRYEKGAALPDNRRLGMLLTRMGVLPASALGQQIAAAATAVRCQGLPAPVDNGGPADVLDRVVAAYFELSGHRRGPEAELVIRAAFEEALRGR